LDAGQLTPVAREAPRAAARPGRDHSLSLKADATMEPLIVRGDVVLLALFLIATYNGLVAKRNRVRNAWSQIDVQLKRRHDLIANLVSTVKGYLQHESGELE